MTHAEAVDWGGVVAADLLLLRVEAYALADEGFWRAMVAPDGEGHFETDGENTIFDFVRPGAEGVLASELVGAEGAFMLWRDIASHVEALHFEENVGLSPYSTSFALEYK